MATPIAPLALAGCLALAQAAEAPPASPAPLPRSSIAAVLARRGELGLTDAEVSQLEKRDAALQDRVAQLRQAAASPGPKGSGKGGAPAGGPPSSPGDGPPHGGGRPGGDGGGRHGERSAQQPHDPASRAAALEARIDDADTEAWLSAEAALDPSRRERAREVAEKYREALADRREAAGKR